MLGYRLNRHTTKLDTAYYGMLVTFSKHFCFLRRAAGTTDMLGFYLGPGGGGCRGGGRFGEAGETLILLIGMRLAA